MIVALVHNYRLLNISEGPHHFGGAFLLRERIYIYYNPTVFWIVEVLHASILWFQMQEPKLSTNGRGEY
jgi:hypothetical protein